MTPAQPDVLQPTWTIFLDRDGVFNPNPRLLIRRPEAYHFLPGAQAAFARLNQPNIKTCLCTNQPFTIPLLNVTGLARVHAHLKEELRLAGGRLDRIEAAWAPPFTWHRRRKPRPGLLEDGGAALGAVPERSFMVGDKVRDAQAGLRWGARPILLATSRTREQLERALRRHGIAPEQVPIVSGLPEAVELILATIRNT